ncbi:MAG TPA: S41 family peptidase [Pirellulaceae bacterium]|nr:S41 family peptidase [Pirellulaceae bacterium]
MRSRMSTLRLAVLAWLLTIGALSFDATSRFARAETPTSTADDARETEVLLERGRQFERDRRWADALNHYETAVRNHPAHRELLDRLTLAKAHFDVGRRYSDSSFVNSTSRTPQKEALDVYVEVLTKINTHHVHAANWHDLVRQGTFYLEVALTEPVFLRRYVPQVSADRINACRREIRQMTDNRVPRNRNEARDLVDWAGRIALERIGLPASATTYEYICGAMNSLDDYSSFLSGDQLDDVFSQIEGNFVGLGIELKAEGGELLLVNVISGSPADKGGLRKSDRIVAVDGRSTRDVSADAAADMLKGAEGTAVEIDVLDAAGNQRSVKLLRERVEVPSVEDVKIVDPDTATGYLRLTSFQKTTSRDVDQALWRLHEQGMKVLIIDVRGNPGGLLTAAVEVADKFLQGGTIVMTRGRSANEDNDYKARPAGTWRVPLVVLIDGDSASASEIFAGAIRDQRRGTIVGQRSFGKGSVQGIFPLSSANAGVRLTTAKFYSPSGHEINKRGVTPDVVVRTTAKLALDGSRTEPIAVASPDATLNAALQVVRTQLTLK